MTFRIGALRIGLLASLGLLTAPALSAQASAGTPTQVVSANPFGIMLNWFNAEYEHSAGESFTVGVSGSFFSSDNSDYRSLDAFWRFYPQAEPQVFEGWAFGLKAGVTGVDHRTYFGVGFDVDKSWLLGRNHNFYVGVGGGLKRLFARDAGIKIIPTIRLVNIGVAF